MRIARNLLLYSIIFISISFLIISKVFSLDCSQDAINQNLNPSDLQKIIEICTQKRDELHNAANTLRNQIQYMNTQIYLTTLKIQSTKQKIIDTQKEMDLISARIDNLESSFDQLSKTFYERIKEGYKTQRVSLLSMLLDNDNVNDFLNHVKYQKTTQENNQKLLIQVQESKLNFEEQKKIREKKKTDLALLQNTLNSQQQDLNSQKANKQQLLTATQNDENSYQKLLDDAQKQLASFKSFVKTAGGGVISANGFGNGSDGWYVSQRDERWAGKTMGYSSDTVMEVGCLITDIAMIMKKSGIDWTPLNVASDPNYFVGNTAYMYIPSRFSWPNGLNYVNISISEIDDEIKAGRPVIVGMNVGPYGSHYIILKEISGSTYKMHDPYIGPDKTFSDYYSKSSIFVAAVFK